MKGRISSTSRLSEPVRYVLQSKPSAGAHGFLRLIAASGLYASEDEIVADFRRIRELRNEVRHPYIRLSLSLVDEKLTRSQWAHVLTWILNRIGLDTLKYQFVADRHVNTRNDHIHCLANRIALDGSLWCQEWSFIHLMDACQDAERHFNMRLSAGRSPNHTNVAEGLASRSALHETIARSNRSAKRRNEKIQDFAEMCRVLLQCSRANCLQDYQECALQHGVVVEPRAHKGGTQEGLVARESWAKQWFAISAITQGELSAPILEGLFDKRRYWYENEMMREDDLSESLGSAHQEEVGHEIYGHAAEVIDSRNEDASDVHLRRMHELDDSSGTS